MPSDDGPVRVGVVGCGAFGRLHARTLGRLAEARLVAVVDPDAGRLGELEGIDASVLRCGDVEEAIGRSGAEAWVVASSTATHAGVAERLLRGGDWVLVEKPLTATLAEAEALGRWVDGESRRLMAGHVVLFNSEFRQLLDEAAGRGPMRLIDAVRHRSSEHADWFADEDPLRLTMVHDLYLVQALVDGEEPAVMGARWVRGGDGRRRVVTAELTWAGGLTARLAASFMTPGGLGSDGFDRLEVLGDGWGARIAPNPRPMVCWDQRVSYPMSLEIRQDAVSATGMLAEELRCFCRVVRGRQDVPRGARYADALQLMRWIDRLAASADAGEGPQFEDEEARC